MSGRRLVPSRIARFGLVSTSVAMALNGANTMWTHLIRLGQHTFEVTANCQAAALRMLRQQYDPNYEQKCFVVNQRYVYGVPVPAISARSRTDELP